MMVVPNHLVGQWAKEFYALYPAAKLLAVNEKDFCKKQTDNAYLPVLLQVILIALSLAIHL